MRRTHRLSHFCVRAALAVLLVALAAPAAAVPEDAESVWMPVEIGARKTFVHRQDRTVEAHGESLGERDGDWANPEALLSRFGDQEMIDALRLLPEGYRWALLLVDVQSLTIEEAAQTLDVAPGTIKSRLHRGRAMLRDRLHGFATQRGWLTDKQSHAAAEGKSHD